MSLIKPILKTAPSELPFYEELDLDGLGIWELDSPADLDVVTRDYLGADRRTRVAMRRRVRLLVDGLTEAEARILQRWKHDRVRLRPQGFHSQYTKFLQVFQRSDPSGGSEDVASEIGGSPTFSRAIQYSSADTDTSFATFRDRDGKIYTVANDVPRYELGFAGMKGILLETTSRNHITYSQPGGTHLLWSTSSGTPTISDTPTGIDPILAGYTGGHTRILGTAGDVVAFTLGKTAVDAASPAWHSFSTWVKGWGTITLRAKGNVTGILASNSNLVLNGQWQQISVVDFLAGGSDTSYVIEIALVTDAIFACGPTQFEDAPHVTSYIHNPTGNSPMVRETDSLFYADVPVLQNEATIFVAFTLPKDTDTVDAWIFHKAIGATHFGLKYRGDTKQFTFYRKTATMTYVTALNAGDDILITITIAKTQMALFENGSLKTAGVPSVNQSLSGGIYLGDLEIGSTAAGVPISMIRFDDKYLDATEASAESLRWINDETKPWQQWFSGRDFELEKIPLEIPDGNENEFMSNAATLVEVDSTRSATVEEA